jgi:hypothetical protein
MFRKMKHVKLYAKQFVFIMGEYENMTFNSDTSTHLS